MFYVIFGKIVILSHAILNFPNNFLDDDVGFDVIGWVLGSATSICNEENFKREALALSTSNFLYLHLCIIQIQDIFPDRRVSLLLPAVRVRASV